MSSFPSMNRARLLLEDGSVFYGNSFGAAGEVYGEVVFNTGMTGYQEILTDPSYCGQIVTMTYPLIGNYGTNPDDMESQRSQVRAFVVREFVDFGSHHKQTAGLEEYLLRYNIMGICNIDTRKLTKLIRNHGTMKAILTTYDTAQDEILKMFERPLERNQVDVVTTKTPYHCPGTGYRVVAMDFGMKTNILRRLLARGLDVVVVPANSTVDEILSWHPDGLFLSNGPGDPMDIPGAVATIRDLLGQVPIFGVCMGHQLMALAAGATTEKMRFGHRGSNHPVRELATNRVVISSQNHGYVVNPHSILETDLVITHVNQNDGTVEGLEHTKYPAFCVQYHPEAHPGPADSDYLFDRFVEMMENVREGRWQPNA